MLATDQAETVPGEQLTSDTSFREPRGVSDQLQGSPFHCGRVCVLRFYAVTLLVANHTRPLALCSCSMSHISIVRPPPTTGPPPQGLARVVFLDT